MCFLQRAFAARGELERARVQAMERADVNVKAGELVILKYGVPDGIRTPDEPLAYAVARVQDIAGPKLYITWYRQFYGGQISSDSKEGLMDSFVRAQHREVKESCRKNDWIDQEAILLAGAQLTEKGRFARQKIKRDGHASTTSTYGQLVELLEAGLIQTIAEVDAEATASRDLAVQQSTTGEEKGTEEGKNGEEQGGGEVMNGGEGEEEGDEGGGRRLREAREVLQIWTDETRINGAIRKKRVKTEAKGDGEKVCSYLFV